MITREEVEMLASLLQRAGVTQIEATWANAIMDRLRAEAAGADLKQEKDSNKTLAQEKGETE